jgi:Ca2+-binding EF-hand superfamily protein
MPEESWRDDFEEAFTRFDGDENGRLDREEFERLLDALGSTLSPRDREMGFLLVDADGDGSITREELLGWWEIVREEGRS